MKTTRLFLPFRSSTDTVSPSTLRREKPGAGEPILAGIGVGPFVVEYGDRTEWRVAGARPGRDVSQANGIRSRYLRDVSID
jgi:hypothetical protein